MLKTFSILKPDVIRRNLSGKINSMIEAAGFKIIAQKLILISKKQAQMFYIEHKDRPFYNDLCEFMSSGPIIVEVLSSTDNTVKNYRNLMGATDPKSADEGTIRKLYGMSIDHNAVHGSDSNESAQREIAFFFSQIDLLEP